MLNASTVPSEALLPIAAMHCPLVTAAADAVELTRYDVFAVVVTVRDVAGTLPNPSVFTTNCEPELLVTVPVAPNPPVPPRPPGKPPGPPAPGERLGAGVGAPEGRAPPENPPRPPKLGRAAQADVEVTVTLVAVTEAVGDGDALLGREPEPTVTQSPTATEDREPVATRVNRVEVAHATTVVPELVATLTPEPETAVALPVAAVKLPNPPLPFAPPSPPWPPSGPALLPAAPELDVPVAPFAELQAVSTNAASARPAAGSNQVRVGGVFVT
jgi:hypothetical protein